MRKNFFKGTGVNQFCTVCEAIIRLNKAGYSKDVFIGAENGSGFYYIGAANEVEIDNWSDEMIGKKAKKLAETNRKLSAHIKAFPGVPRGSGDERFHQFKQLATYASTLKYLSKICMSLQNYKNQFVPVLERRIVKEPYARIAKDGLVLITTGIETKGEWWKGESNEAKKLGLEELEEYEEVEEDDE